MNKQQLFGWESIVIMAFPLLLYVRTYFYNYTYFIKKYAKGQSLKKGILS